MTKQFLLAIGVLSIAGAFTLAPSAGPRNPDGQKAGTAPDSLGKAIAWPDDLSLTIFAGPDIVPSPACLAAAPDGTVFVGVDQIGSLGKQPNKGNIIRLVDNDHDGKADSHTVFAMIDNPRGILPVGDQVFVLHTTFSKTTAIATGMDLAVLEDRNHDGVADGPEKVLLQGICSPKFLQERGTDHAANGIRMGIDGWIYAAIGDFGFYNATDRSGTRLTLHGGGIIRVRPDGTGMELYSHGLRNIYDVAIDPLMNIFTRDNTNDGGGWNIRFSHQVQTGEYGYPLLFKNFTEEIIPALVDVGGGSGTGALYMDEPGWPEQYRRVPMMADWGNSYLYIHRVTPDGASFTQQEERFIRLPQITDLDIDGSGELFLSAWDGAGYSGSPSKGFVVRVVPKKWDHKPFPDLVKLPVSELTKLLISESAVARLHAQQELLVRPDKAGVQAAVSAIMFDRSLPAFARVAAMYTYSQSLGADAVSKLEALSSEEGMREYALRALADRKEFSKSVQLQPFLAGLGDRSPRVQAASIIGLGRLGRAEAIAPLLKTAVPASFVEPTGKEGPHATPNAPIVLPHLAVRALLSLGATTASLREIGGPNTTLALWTLRYVHSQTAVTGLIAAYRKAPAGALKSQLLQNISRLYKRETPYTGETWWNTRPDGHGPYYDAVTWQWSPLIRDFLLAEWRKATTPAQKDVFKKLNEKFQMEISEFGTTSVPVARVERTVDFNRIKSRKGQIGTTSIENIILAMTKIPGEPAQGKAIFMRQGCFACHSLTKNEPLKGPYMGQIGSIMNREQIAESILKPNASISQGFATVMLTLKGNKTLMGFVTAESASQLTMRDIAGQVTTVKKATVLKRKEMESSMMPTGLANPLSFEEFASLITFLSRQK